MAKKYSDLATLSNKNLVMTLKGYSPDELLDLLKQADNRYLYYGEQAKEYSSDQGSTMSTENFLKLIGKIKKCEQIIILIIGTITFKQNMADLDETSADIINTSQENMKKTKEMLAKDFDVISSHEHAL